MITQFQVVVDPISGTHTCYALDTFGRLWRKLDVARFTGWVEIPGIEMNTSVPMPEIRDPQTLHEIRESRESFEKAHVSHAAQTQEKLKKLQAIK